MMQTDADYTLADIVELTGAKRRSVQFWTEYGVIKADPTTEHMNRGTHRRFSKDEALIAAVVNFVYTRMAYSVGTLIRIAAALRAKIAVEGRQPLLERGYLIAKSNPNQEWTIHLTDTIPLPVGYEIVHALRLPIE